MQAIKKYEEVLKVVAEKTNGSYVSFDVREGGFMCKEGETRTITLTLRNKDSFNGREELHLNCVDKGIQEGEGSEWEVTTSSTGRNEGAMSAFVRLVTVAAAIQKELNGSQK